MATLRLADPEALVWYDDLPGVAPPVVYVHGLGGSCSAMPGVVRHPHVADRRAIVLDLIGHGFTEPVADFGYGPEDHARVVAALLDHLGVTGAAIVGHSAGGPVAVCLATLRPDLVSRLILAEGNLDPALAGVSKVIAAQPEADYVAGGHAALLAQIRPAALAGDDAMAAVFATSRVADPRAVHRTAVRMNADTRPPLWERFVGLAIPRAYLYGERNIREPRHAQAADGLRSHGVAVLTVPDAGHVMMVDNPDGFAAAVAAALQGE